MCFCFALAHAFASCALYFTCARVSISLHLVGCEERLPSAETLAAAFVHADAMSNEYCTAFSAYQYEDDSPTH